MKFPSCLDKFVQISNRADIRVCECLDGKVAGDGQDNNRVEVVRKKSDKIRARTLMPLAEYSRCFDTTDKGIDGHTNWQ